MITFDKTTRDELTEQVRSVLSYSQGVSGSDLSLDPLMEHWFESKKKIIEKFSAINNEDWSLICELDEVVEIELSANEKRQKYERFRSSLGWANYMVSLRNFLDANYEGFFENRVVADYTVQVGGQDKIITKGSKILKAFKYFIKNESERKQYQDLASMAIQDGKIKGKLCLSVHPLDYLSSSENTYNWRSCHALDGEYRAGNLSYMTDKSTIVCYLKGEEDAQLPNFPQNIKWNSKKWRMLLFLSDEWNAMFAGRQYPMMIPSILDKIQLVARICLGLSTYGSWSGWHDDQITQFNYKDKKDEIYLRNPYIPMGNRIYPIHNLIKDGENTYHYNDLLKSSCYTPMYCWNKSDTGAGIHFHIGEEVKCLHCNEYKFSDSDNIFCDGCCQRYGGDGCTCSDCGNWVREDNLIYIDYQDRYICRYCYEHYYSICDNCDGIYENDDLIEHDGCYYCQDCYERLIERERMREE